MLNEWFRKFLIRGYPHFTYSFIEEEGGGGGNGVVSQIWQNMTRADGWQNLTNHGNSEKMWNTNGKVSRAVGAKIFK